MAADLAGRFPPMPVWSSPRLRTQETAAPLAAAWDATIAISPAFDEIPSPSEDPGERKAWLASALVSNWTDLGPTIERWHGALLEAVRTTREDIVVFTHFVAVNAVVGAAEGRPEVVVFAPAYVSVTVVDVDADTGAITVVERGSEATPEVG